MLEEIKLLFIETLQLGQLEMDGDTPLLGSIPELDSMAVVSIITAIEDNYGIEVEDDEISAETFETLGSFVEFVETKVNE